MNIMSIYVSYHPEKGGIQSVIKNLSEHLFEKGHSTTVVCLTNKDYLNFEKINGVDVFRIRSNFPNYFMAFTPKFLQFIKDNTLLFDKMDIINVHSYHTPFSWQVIRILNYKGYGNKIVFTPHYEGIGFTSFKSFLHKIYRLCAKSSFEIPNRIVCVSDYEKNNLCKKFRIPNSKIRVIPNGINYKIPEKQIYKKIENKITLLYVGRVEQKKGIQYILEAIKYFVETYPIEVEFNVVGVGSYLNELKKIVFNYNLNNIHFLGRLSDDELEAVFHRSDIFCLLSQSEAYGIVVAEALAHGLVGIVSERTALIEFLSENGCFGIEYPPDPIELADLIYQFYGNRITIGPLNKNKICSWSEVSGKYELLYQELLSQLS